MNTYVNLQTAAARPNFAIKKGQFLYFQCAWLRDEGQL